MGSDPMEELGEIGGVVEASGSGRVWNAGILRMRCVHFTDEMSAFHVPNERILD